MKPVRRSLIAAVALVLSAGGAAVLAQNAPPPPAPRPAAQPNPPQRPRISMDQAVRLAQHRFKAQVVRAETQTQGGRTIYVLRMLDDSGRVFAVRVDAASGAIS
jgi:uncharacterized membrane protein YkoI